jgi:hypothetical protein
MRRLARLIAFLAGITALAACAVLPPPETSPADEGRADCHPAADLTIAQYIIGYGSLMQDESRKRTSPHAAVAHPVEVSGFQRRWIARGDAMGFSTTYLGVTADPAAQLTAVMYQVDLNDLRATDLRESSYCRVQVAVAQLKPLEKSLVETEPRQAWIYVNKPGAIATPSAQFPIVESYVDIFVAGCLEQEQRFELEGFAARCLTTTRDWSAHWVNDRIYPRRPFIYQPKAHQIDALLAKTLPAYFTRIRID